MAGKSPPEPRAEPKEEKEMMEYISQQVLLLKEKAMLQASVREEKKLLVEHGKLKKDIEELKRKLQETQKRKAVKLHQERALTASVAEIKSAILDVSVPTEDPPEPRNQRSNTHTHTEGRRDWRGTRENPAAGSKGASGSVSGLEHDRRLDVSRLELRIGRVLTVRKLPDSESHYVHDVDLGDSALRTVVTELANQISPEQLENTLVVLLCNVRPVKLHAVQSQARILCAVNQNKMEPLAPPTSATPGDRVTFKNYPGEPEKSLNPKRRIWERLLPDLRTDQRGVANYKGVAFEVRGKGVCRAPTISNGGIK